MKEIIIYGAGGLGKEIAWLIENINLANHEWDILGFVDDGKYRNKRSNRYQILGSGEILKNIDKKVFVICAIGNGKTRQLLYSKMTNNINILLATLIDPSVTLDNSIRIGEGSIVCKNCSLTVDTTIGKGVLLNIGSLVGHDSEIGDYTTLSPQAMVVGNTNIGKYCNLGAGSFILEGTQITDETIVAPLSGVYKDISKPGLYSGNPARQIR